MRFIESYFKEQKGYIDFFFDHLNMEKADQILRQLLKCRGSIIFTGVGKSGIIAQKLAMTMLSTGTKALYMPAIDAMHGDLGMVTKEDIFVFLSKSGETKELINLLPFVKKKGASTIAFVSKSESFLYKQADLSIELPITRELCPFNLAPTTSTEVQLIFGDVLAVAMMNKKNFSLQEYALNHPAGSIGKKISLFVEDIMFRKEKLPLAKVDDVLIDLLPHISEKRCGCILIVDNKEHLVGIFTDGDLRRCLEKEGAKALGKRLDELMNPNPKMIKKGTLVYEALCLMERDPEKPIQALPVLDDEKVVGIVRMHDILQAGL